MKSRRYDGKQMLHKTIDILPWLVMLLLDLWLIRYFGRYGKHWFNADVSSEMVLAKLLNQESRFFSPNWFYSTELRVVTNVLTHRLGLLFSSSWHTARTISIGISLVTLQAGTVWMLCPTRLWKFAPIFAAIVALPFSEKYLFLLPYGGFYVGHTLLCFMILGALIRLSDSKRRSGSVFGAFSAALLSILWGLGGVRPLIMLGIPAFATAFLLTAQMFGGRVPVKEKARSLYLLAGGASALAGAVLGCLINRLVLSEIFCFESFDDLRVVSIKLV